MHRLSGTHNFAVYDLKPEMLIEALKKRFGEVTRYLSDIMIMIRRRNHRTIVLFPRIVIDVTSIPDIQELLSFVDAGITDYSSWIYDFILSRKQVYLCKRYQNL